MVFLSAFSFGSSPKRTKNPSRTLAQSPRLCSSPQQDDRASQQGQHRASTTMAQTTPQIPIYIRLWRLHHGVRVMSLRYGRTRSVLPI